MQAATATAATIEGRIKEVVFMASSYGSAGLEQAGASDLSPFDWGLVSPLGGKARQEPANEYYQ
jgi:hypothetical protein